MLKGLHHIEIGATAVLIDNLGGGENCPKCGKSFSAKVLSSWRRGRKVFCTSCRFSGSWRQITRVKGSHLSSGEILLAAFAFKAGADPKGVAKVLGVHFGTAKRLHDTLAGKSVADQSGY